MKPRLLNLLVRFWRLAALVLAAVLLHRSALPPKIGSGDVSLSEARAFFPTAEVLTPGVAGAITVSNGATDLLGTLITTSPEADRITGYNGPSNLLVAIDKEGRIAGSKILESADTPSHVDALRQQPSFANSFKGWNPSTEPPPNIEGIGGSTLTGLAMVEGIAQRLAGSHSSLRFPEPLSIEEIRSFFPDATSFVMDTPRQGWHRVLAPSGDVAGFVVRTAPASDGITGYAGPTECLVAVAPDAQTLRAVRIRKSYDTEEYVERVTEDKDYLKSLTRWRVSQWPGLSFEAEKIEGVAGATLTSASIAEGLKERFKPEPPSRSSGKESYPLKDVALWLLLCIAALQAFTNLRGSKLMRGLWQALLIGVLGLWLGHFLSLGLLTGWAQNGPPWKQAAPLVALTAAAVLVPWGARRQIYCHHLCPHGAAQEWLGRLSRRNISLPKAAHDTLRILPGILLAAGFLCALRLPLFPIGNLEPFDFWILGRAAVVPAVLAFLGLGLSVFVPMAYCRYGCPTGALLSFVRSASSRELFGKRDAFAALVLLSAWLLTPSNPRPLPGEHVEAMRGTGFGTTWCVKLRGEPAVHEQLHASLTAEVRRIEATLSHWSKDSATSRFNASTSTEEQPIPQELGKLVNFALRLHRKTAGAYDITVSSLVSAWGYGPAGETSTVPSDAHLQTLLAMVGSEKLTLNPNGTGLRKSHSAVTLDLGSLLQGYAVDRLCALLDAGGLTNYLVEVGGELRSRGAWRVALENPGKPNSPLKIVTLKDSALATSGLPRARRRLEGQMVSHIISPKTGRPVAPTIEACSVQHSTCLEADGWATAVIASGLPAADALAKRESLAVWVLDATGVFKRLE